MYFVYCNINVDLIATLLMKLERLVPHILLCFWCICIAAHIRQLYDFSFTTNISFHGILFLFSNYMYIEQNSIKHFTSAISFIPHLFIRASLGRKIFI